MKHWKDCPNCHGKGEQAGEICNDPPRKGVHVWHKRTSRDLHEICAICGKTKRRLAPNPECSGTQYRVIRPSEVG